MTNIFNLPLFLPDEELFESIVCNDKILIERIISTGQTTPKGEWYNGAYKLPNRIRETAPCQDKNEWVILLQGEAVLSYEDKSQIELKAGDYLFIPAHKKHRVEYTSTSIPCIWLAVHGNLSKI